jgi:hypothetical protein
MAMEGSGNQLPSAGEVGARLEEWRRNRQGGAAIPDELWSAAIEVARRDGVSRTATALRLDYTTGRGKASNSKRPNRSIKEVLGYALSPRFRELLSQS